jgi:hypothetical protein
VENAASKILLHYFNVRILSTLDLTIIFISPGVVIFPLAFPSLSRNSSPTGKQLFPGGWLKQTHIMRIQEVMR